MTKTRLVHHFLERQSRCRPEAVLVIDGKRQSTYADIEASANQVAQALRTHGVRPGDRVALVAVNSTESVIAYYGILKSGGVVVELDPTSKWGTIRHILNDAEVTALVVGRRPRLRLSELADVPSLKVVITWNATAAGESVASCQLVDWKTVHTTMPTQPLNLPLAPDAQAAIVYTSGSTGKPKGVVLRHANLVANTEAIVQYLDLTSRDRIFVVLPFHYVYGKSLLNTHVDVGGSVVLENGFQFPQRALDRLELTQATGLSGVPSTFAILLDRSNFAARTLPNLRYMTQAGGPMAAPLQQRLLATHPDKRLFIMYGATEAAARLSYLDLTERPDKAGSIGRAIPGVRLRVLRDDGSEADAGEVGELVAEGPNIMEGYWRDLAETHAVLDGAGYHTGDLGRRDAEGFLYVVGRKREMIKSGAHRIAPREIEDVLLQHEAVHEAAVVGQPDPLLGEIIVAFIAERDACAVPPELLQRWCRSLLPPHKVPRRIHIVSPLPHTAAGKIDKQKLRAALAPTAPIPQLDTGIAESQAVAVV